jgi:hypothetical protein
MALIPPLGGPRLPPTASSSAPQNASPAVAKQRTEVPLPSAKTGFASVLTNGESGAWYRKVQSGSSSSNQGIDTRGVLPTPTFDPSRVDATGASRDVPDVYIGGHSSRGGEIDCGLSWSRVQDDSGHLMFTDVASGSDGADPVHRFFQRGQQWLDGTGQKLDAHDPRLSKLKPDFAFHPYFRTAGGGKNVWLNHEPGDTHQTYFYPGQHFSMKLNVDKAGKAQLDISAPGGDSFRAHFTAPGFGSGSARSFKRIIAFDQAGNEGKATQPTSATLTNGGWDAVRLIKFDGSSAPLSAKNATLVIASDQSHVYDRAFRVTKSNDQGGEWLALTPPRK